jgi:hypothetical protein
MGVASGLFGIGGGIITVPLLISFFAVSDLVAKGTSLLVTIPTSLVGTAADRRPGLVDIRVALVVGLAAAVAAVPAAGVCAPVASTSVWCAFLSPADRRRDPANREVGWICPREGAEPIPAHNNASSPDSGR